MYECFAHRLGEKCCHVFLYEDLSEDPVYFVKRLNEEFGIGEVSLKMTASGKDRLIYAEDKKEENI